MDGTIFKRFVAKQAEKFGHWFTNSSQISSTDDLLLACLLSCCHLWLLFCFASLYGNSYSMPLPSGGFRGFGDRQTSSSSSSSPSSSSAFPTMLDLQSGEWGEVHSLPQCLNRSPKLPVGIHRTGPCLASQSVGGGAGLQDVVGALKTCAAWTLVWMGNFQSVEVGEELTVFSSQSKDCDLSCSVQLVDAVLFCPNV